MKSMSVHHRLLAILPLMILSGLPIRAKSADPTEVNPEAIIQRFAEKESRFRQVWVHYTYTERIRFQVIDRNGDPQEQRDMTIDVYFTNDGERKTRVVADEGEIVSVQVTDQDLTDATGMDPFVLTTEELPKYKIEYVGKEKVDELTTYVFDVEPKEVDLRQRYFKGRIWVDDIDLQVVMARGKIVPDLGNNKFPKFETVRQQIDGKYWFPTWTKADDVLTFGSHFSLGGIFGNGGESYRRVHIREYINYDNYKKFEVGASIRYGDVEDPQPGP